jgi:hypothetical protein
MGKPMGIKSWVGMWDPIAGAVLPEYMSAVLTEGRNQKTVPDRLNYWVWFNKTHEPWIRIRYTYGETGLADFFYKTKTIVPRGLPNKAVKEPFIEDKDLIQLPRIFFVSVMA